MKVCSTEPRLRLLPEEDTPGDISGGLSEESYEKRSRVLFVGDSAGDSKAYCKESSAAVARVIAEEEGQERVAEKPAMICLWLEDFALQVHRKWGQKAKAAGTTSQEERGNWGLRAGGESLSSPILLQPEPLLLVDRDDPQGVILQLCEGARDLSIVPGMRYAQALSLSMDLRAKVFDEEAMKRAQAQILKILQTFALDVDQFLSMEGVFWLRWRGMERYEPSISDWADKVIRALGAKGWSAAVGTGFQKRSVLAGILRKRALDRQYGRALANTSCFYGGAQTLAEELEVAGALDLDRLPLQIQILGKLQRLGITKLEDLKRCAYGSLAERFGRELADWLSAVTPEGEGQRDEEVKLQEIYSPLGLTVDLDSPAKNLGILQRHIEILLLDLGEQLVQSSLYARAIILDFWTRPRWKNDFASPRRAKKCEEIVLAEATRELAPMRRLIELRLSQNPPADPVEKIGLRVRTARPHKEQLSLLGAESKRDFYLGDQALARIRAELGNDAVQWVELCEEHLPERSFAWRSYAKMKVGVVATTKREVLVRRLDKRARRVSPPRKRHWGPFSLRSDWWDKAIDREYFFEETQEDEMRWIYFDRISRRWYQQGDVG